MKHLIVYDLDGTLLDTSQEIAHANAYVLSRLGASRERLEEVQAFVGHGMRDLVAWGLKHDDPALVEEAETLFAAYYARDAGGRNRLYPAALHVLEYFKGRAQAVLTDRPNPFARDLIEALGVSHYFVSVVTGDSLYPRKPDPAGLRALIAEANVIPEDTLLIGDSPLDIEAGRRAGVFTVAVSHGMNPVSALRAAAPDVLVNDLVQLLQHAKQNSW